MKQIKDLPYWISPEGYVFNARGRLMSVSFCRKGYPKVSLYYGKVIKKRIHRLVAETYIPNPDNLPQVNHIDGIKTNNHVSNLEWCDNDHNIAHATRNGLRAKGEKVTVGKLTEKDVLDIRASTLETNILSQQYNVSETTIRCVRRRATWKHI